MQSRIFAVRITKRILSGEIEGMAISEQFRENIRDVAFAAPPPGVLPDLDGDFSTSAAKGLTAEFGGAARLGLADHVDQMPLRLHNMEIMIRDGQVPESAANFMTNSARIGAAHLAETKARKDRAAQDAGYLILLQRQIADLQRQIAAFDDRIAELEKELEAIAELRTLVASGEYDPSNPDHADLAKAAGVPADELDGPDALDTIRAEEEARQDELEKVKARRVEAADELAQVQARHDDMVHANDTGEQPDFTQSHYDGMIEAYTEAGHSFDREAPSQEEVTAIRRFEMERAMGAAADLTQVEQEILTLEDLAKYEGQADYIGRIDDFLNQIDEDAK
ncbi:hypothetical protein AY600_17960 [Phormidium willei BDU 130791]|nr:hypothetical protein AY600_17960 [Phormidium willei BDU 130791]